MSSVERDFQSTKTADKQSFSIGTDLANRAGCERTLEMTLAARNENLRLPVKT
jgi:hypothetical protein